MSLESRMYYHRVRNPRRGALARLQAYHAGSQLRA